MYRLKGYRPVTAYSTFFFYTTWLGFLMAYQVSTSGTLHNLNRCSRSSGCCLPTVSWIL